MASLDYAYLADYAQVSEGRLTAVGASFTHVYAPTLPSQLQFAVAGRIRTTVDAEPSDLEFVVTPPDQAPQLTFGGTIGPASNERPYDGGKVGLLFSVGINLNLLTPGLYTVEIRLGGEVARKLRFEVEIPSEDAHVG